MHTSVLSTRILASLVVARGECASTEPRHRAWVEESEVLLCYTTLYDYCYYYYYYHYHYYYCYY